ncbi:hypothetical protein N9D29_03590 [Flavobacteriaceae bacterium]|nr:hypothetical protein [Flavobacteriaceae bacterium]
MKTEHPKIAKIFTDCANKAKSETNICMHPNCNEKAINSHIMQKNGILSSIADDKHLWESSIDHFKKEYTRLHKKGINKIYTFTGFCNNHDSSIFSKIETEGAIDFQDYESCLLFALRTTYNELWLKEVVIKMQECVINHSGVDTDNQMLRETIRQNELGIKDLEHYTKSMWNDLENKTQSFVFEHREMDYKEICLNAIFTYDTSSEIMDYHKDDTAKVKSYVNLFFKENIKRTHKRLSSLIIFNCETWVCSNTFYKEKFEGLDSEFFKAMKFSAKNGNERKTFNFDLFKTDFKTTFKNFINKNVG